MTIRYLLLAILLALLPSCGSRGVKASGTNYAPAASMASYRTWAWSPKRSFTLRDPSRNTATVQGWLEQAIDSELGLKGLIKADPGSADLLASYAAGSRQLQSSQEFSAQGELTGSRLDEAGGSGGAFAQRGTLDKDYEEGRLTIDLIDRKTGQVVYRGQAKADMLEKPSASRSIPRIKKVISKMLANFRSR